LAAVVISVKLARARGGDLTLVTPRSAAVSRVFTLTRLDKVFTMVPAAARSESP
jgi:anti-anti-sigma regulatory factor